MVTGPEHYREAERRLTHLALYGGDIDPTLRAAMATEAHAHATLALAAATALIDESPRGDSFAAYRAWEAVAGPPKSVAP